MDFNENRPIVCDNGTGYVKKDVYLGYEAQTRRGMLGLSYPIEHEIVRDWEAMERFWEHAFDNELRVNIDEHPVLLTEAPLNPRNNREKMVEIISNLKTLEPYKRQLMNGIVIDARVVMDSGEGVTHVVPIYEGYALHHAIHQLDLAEKDLTAYLTKILAQEGYIFTTLAEQEIVRDIKEHLSYVAMDIKKEPDVSRETSELDRQYELPDGQRVTWMLEEMFGNVVLSGGTTSMPVLANRLAHQLPKGESQGDCITG
ncbi:hypothetical protein Gotur_000598 [Gossypium turneri]